MQTANNTKPHRRPRPVPQLEGAELSSPKTVTNPRNAAASAMLDAGISPEQVHAYMKTGNRITTANEASYSEEDVEAYKVAVQEYLLADEEAREEMIRPAKEPR